jgi:acetyltransferase-like isoleucine patch superfamily enzyme
MWNPFQRIFRRLAYFVPGGFRLRPGLHRLRGVKIGKNVWISQYVYIDELHPEAIEIGDNVTIGIGSAIISHLYWTKSREPVVKPVVIESDVFIGPHCVILPGVRIGKGSVVQAGTVVSRNVPAGVFLGHQPASILGKVSVPLTAEHSYQEFVQGLRPVRQRGEQDDKG